MWAASWISSAASSSEVVDIGGADRGGHRFDDLPVAQLAGLGHAQELKAVERLVLTTEVGLHHLGGLALGLAPSFSSSGVRSGISSTAGTDRRPRRHR